MRSLIPAALLLPSALSAGCGLQLVCPHDPHDWYDHHNATYSLLEADFADNKGSFDFDPVGKGNSRRRGSYSLKSGDLNWVDNYKADYWMDERKVDGYGTIYDNGNLDLLAKVTYSDVLGAEWADLVRLERYRCECDMVRYDFDPDWTVDDPPSADAHTEYWVAEIRSDTKVTMYGEYSSSGSKKVINRTLTDKVLYKDEWDYGDGASVGETKIKYDGTGEASWSQWGDAYNSDYDYIGEEEFFFDGSYQQDYYTYEANTSNKVSFWSLLHQYDGSATGTYEGYNAAGGVSLTCDVVITTGGDCTADCSDGNSYDCS